MSDHFVDPSYQSKHKHDVSWGTPHMPDELQYRYGTHFGRHVTLSDRQFEESYEPDENTPYVEVDEGSLNY